MTVTAAPGTKAFVESVICPRMALVVSPCAQESVGTSEMAAMVKKVRWSTRRRRRLALDLTANPSMISGLAKGRSCHSPRNQDTLYCINYSKQPVNYYAFETQTLSV